MTAFPIPSLLHFKGILTLILWVFAESVSFVNAVNLWSPKSHNQFFQDQFQKETCASVSKPQPSMPFSRLFSKNSAPRVKDCCLECSKCMDAASFVRKCPRGGHLDHAATSTTTSMTPYGIPLNAWKVIFQVLLTAMNVLCWLVPLKSKKITENKLALSLANAFSGGVFLSLAFGHLIPECIHGFDADTPEAAPYLLVLGGYLLIFFVEKVAFDAHDILHEMSEGGEHHHSHSNGSHVPARNTGRSALILLAALGIHSILEMMALGLASSFGDAALLSLSIGLHQPAESIALLVAFLKSGMPTGQIIKYLSIFSCMGPVGVALGMAVNEYASPIVDSIMLAIVAGTFVYVGATEVIPEEWEDSSHKWKKFGALMGGIVSIFAITQYTMQFHDH